MGGAVGIREFAGSHLCRAPIRKKVVYTSGYLRVYQSFSRSFRSFRPLRFSRFLRCLRSFGSLESLVFLGS